MLEAEANHQELARRAMRPVSPIEDRASQASASPARAAGPLAHADLAAWTAVAVVAGIGAFALPPENLLRTALAGLIVFVVPGVLAMEALFPPQHAAPPARRFRLAVSLGLSPAIVGLAALSTALVPGGFRPANIVAAVTVVCIFLGLAAMLRRATFVEDAPPRAAVLSGLRWPRRG